jgi:hypothetical protein
MPPHADRLPALGHRFTQVPGRSLTRELHESPAAEYGRQRPERVSLGLENGGAEAAGGEVHEGRPVERDVMRQVRRERCPEHVLPPRPDQVSVAMIDRKLAVASGYRRADVVHDGRGHVEAPVAEEARAEGQVYRVRRLTGRTLRALRPLHPSFPGVPVPAGTRAPSLESGANGRARGTS